VSLEDLVDQHLDIGFAGDIDGEVPATDFGCDFASGLVLDIGYDYSLGAFGCKTPAQRATDAVSSSTIKARNLLQ
jgi:hypothetical protein